MTDRPGIAWPLVGSIIFGLLLWASITWLVVFSINTIAGS